MCDVINMRVLVALLVTALVWQAGHGRAEDSGGAVKPYFPAGTQEVGLTAGYLLAHRLTHWSVTEQQGPALMPSWGMVLTDPPSADEGWYRGQTTVGVEMVYIQFEQPALTHGIGITPRIKYTFVALDRLRPYLELGGGPFWTDLANRIPEQSSEFNFVVMGGIGLSWFVTSQAAVNIGYRFQHISNAGTSHPNVGLNASLPFIGFSFFY
jgi:opacity protein-like surface antigen